MMGIRVFLMDNLDSFTYNLVDELSTLGYELEVYRNTVSADYILQKMDECEVPAILMLSPGPGNPKQAGSMLELIELCRGKYPIIGICLGHQAIVEQYGGKVGSAGEIIHGKTSIMSHNGHALFNSIHDDLYVARYHSLMATEVPDNLDVIASCNDIPMAIVNEEEKVIGFQFHPESILTTFGTVLLKNSLQYLSETCKWENAA